jgi:hypothetical protein
MRGSMEVVVLQRLREKLKLDGIDKSIGDLESGLSYGDVRARF